MPTVVQNQERWSTYEWSQGGDEWSAGWGGPMQMWVSTILPRIAGFIPCGHVLEIAPGHGRVTNFLVRYCDKLTGVDLVEGCVAACRKRFRWRRGVRFYQNDGRSLDMVRDGSIDFVFSWDSLVHVEADVVGGYVEQIARKLRPGGAGFLHHSNIGAFAGPDGTLTVENPHWRAESMSAAKFRGFCAASGLTVLAQELIPWGGYTLNDCYSAFRKPGGGEPGHAEPPAREPTLVENHDFWKEARAIVAVMDRYAPRQQSEW